jgi:hypothetical protein
MGSALHSEAIPTYEGLRAELIDNYGNIIKKDLNEIHRSNLLYSARIKSIVVQEDDEYDNIGGRTV